MVLVPNVVRKLNLLVDYAGYANIDAVAKRLERSRSAVYGWGDARGGDQVPADRYDVIVDLFHEALKQSLSRQEIARLLALPSDFQLEEEFVSLPARPLMVIIEEEADTRPGRLFLRQNGIGLIETEEQAGRRGDYTVRQGQWFRIEFDTELSSDAVIALQHTGHVWGLVPHAFDNQRGCILMPGIVDGRAQHMRESIDAGIQTFIAVQTKTPLPPVIRNQVINGATLDGWLLNRLANHFDDQRHDQRTLFAMTINVERSGGSRTSGP